MSFEYIINSLKTNNLSSAEKLTVICLANRADDNGKCFPSLQTIANDTSQSVRNAHRIIKKLKQRGIVEQQQQRLESDLRRKRNIYILNLQKIKEHFVKYDEVAKETIYKDSLHGHSDTDNFVTAKNLSELAG